MAQTGIKKSQFTGAQLVDPSATFDFVTTNGDNLKITAADLLAGLGVTGTIEQSGDVLATPVLDIQGAQNLIRNLENGPGWKSSVSPQNGIKGQHNFLQDPNGVAILRNPNALQPDILSLKEGDGAAFSLDGNQLTIGFSGLVAQSSVVTVNKLSDFPAPSGGARLLEPDTAYLQASGVVSPERFILQNNTAVVGISPVIAPLTYTGAGTMFTAVDANCDFRLLNLSCPNAQVFDISESSAPGVTTTAIDTIKLVSCLKIGNLTNLRSVGITDFLAQLATGGFTFSGLDWAAISFARLGLISVDPTFVGIDLGASTSGNIQLEDVAFFGVAGAVGISGLPNSGNVTVDNLSTIKDCNFLGAIAPEGGGLDAENAVRWSTSGNDGIRDTMPDGLVSLAGNATETVIAATDTPVKVTGVWVCERQSIFTCDITGRVTSLSERPLISPLTASFSLLAASGGDKQVSAYLAINGAIVPETKVQVTMNSAKSVAGTLVWQAELNENDFVEVFVENNADTVNIIANGVLRVR